MLSIVFLKFDKQDSAVSTDSGSYCSLLVHSPDCRVEIVNKKSRAGKFKKAEYFSSRLGARAEIVSSS